MAKAFVIMFLLTTIGGGLALLGIGVIDNWNTLAEYLYVNFTTLDTYLFMLLFLIMCVLGSLLIAIAVDLFTS